MLVRRLGLEGAAGVKTFRARSNCSPRASLSAKRAIVRAKTLMISIARVADLGCRRNCFAQFRRAIAADHARDVTPDEMASR
jgi:hypothetical protein